MASISTYNQKNFNICLQFVTELTKGNYIAQYESEVLMNNNMVRSLEFVGITDEQITIINNRLNKNLINIRHNLQYTQNNLFKNYINTNV